MKKIGKFLKENPVVCGVAGSFLVVGIMAAYQFVESHTTVDPKYITQELAQAETQAVINDPKVVAGYLVEAVKEQDLDKALRGMAIDESILNISLANLINEAGEFYTEMEIAPSGSYSNYNELAAAELAGEYTANLENLTAQLKEAGEFQVEEICYVDPKQQLEPEKLSGNSKILENWGGDCLTELMVWISCEEEDYLLGLTMAHYGDSWKVLTLGSALTDTTAEAPMRKTTEEEFAALKGTMKEKDYKKQLQKKNLDSTLFEDTGLTDEDIEEMRLPANYFVLNPLREDTAESTIEAFVRSIQKVDMGRALAYCMDESPEELEHTNVEVLQKQEEIAEMVKRFCYGFLGDDYNEEEASLQIIGKSGRKIVQELDTKYFMYFDLTESVLLQDDGKEQQYAVLFWYAGETYVVGMTLEEGGGGWYIRSLSSEDLGTEPGEIRLVSEEKLKELEKREIEK